MSRHHTKLPLLTRLTALAGSALVLLLTVLAASPQWHAFFHAAEHSARHAVPAASTCPSGHDHHHGHPAPSLPHADDELCVITQFAHGASELAVAPSLLVAQPLARTGDALPLSVFCAPSAPAYLLPPGCGPPAV